MASLAQFSFLKSRSSIVAAPAGQAGETLGTPPADAGLPAPAPIPFDDIITVAFAGGGNRCFWQAGFWTIAAPQLDLQPKRVTAVSAGAAMACALFSGGFDQGFRSFLQAVAENHSNLNIRNLLNQRPLFPHGAMYRNAILTSISGAALARLHSEGPEIFVMVSCPPGWARPGVALMLAA
ncbi:MAG: patatin-like phospholipase family protein, partial [Propionivibrio sp.]